MIPPTINDVHKEYLNKLYGIIKKMAIDKGISEDDDLSSLVIYLLFWDMIICLTILVMKDGLRGI